MKYKLITLSCCLLLISFFVFETFDLSIRIVDAKDCLLRGKTGEYETSPSLFPDLIWQKEAKKIVKYTNDAKPSYEQGYEYKATSSGITNNEKLIRYYRSNLATRCWSFVERFDNSSNGLHYAYANNNGDYIFFGWTNNNIFATDKKSPETSTFDVKTNLELIDNSK